MENMDQFTIGKQEIIKMLLQQIFHMNKGSGDASYATNSALQENIISMGQPVLAEAVLRLIESEVGRDDEKNNLHHHHQLGVADLGCSSGPNSLKVVSDIMKMISSSQYCSPHTLELKIYLNDLPSNDFNSVFSLLSELYDAFKNQLSFFVSAVPGSFYGRLFPTRSLHFVHSSSSLHWLSQAPTDLKSTPPNGEPVLNKGKIYVSETSPEAVLSAYLAQFQEDFTVFLRSRAKELVPGGRMVLSFMGRVSPDPTAAEASCQWELLAKSLMSMVYDGLIDEELINTFNAPYYAPSPNEVQVVIEKEGSFAINRMETLQVYWNRTNYTSHWSSSKTTTSTNNKLDDDQLAAGQLVAKTHRAVVESLFRSHFGLDDDGMDELFRRYGEIVGDHLLKHEAKSVNLVISLIMKD